ncbi:hypothetical protein B0A48_07726 [Cryoendolithus antarcticus]|uniref:DUF7908 domain-containing protein n=1 Tax=Cryoendolithus antarcticus TaxID=1507870 RepID=A0A1V8T7G0_9PEZI|nr:hypothetical protein B0A48_07726 [Cryoendolithus antarcticus]
MQQQVVYEQAVSIDTLVTSNTTFFPLAQAGVTVTNAPTSISGITTLQWTSAPALLTMPSSILSTSATQVSRYSPSPTTNPDDVTFVMLVRNDKDHQKRQSGNFYMSGNGTITQDCTNTPVYTTRNGVLTATVGGVVYTYSTSSGLTFQQFIPSTIPGSITTMFSIQRDGTLSWLNDAFFNGQANFCALRNGIVYSIFVDGGAPDGCLFIQLSLFSVASCQAASYNTVPGPSDKFSTPAVMNMDSTDSQPTPERADRAKLPAAKESRVPKGFKVIKEFKGYKEYKGYKALREPPG